jgi:hypothetical protein
MSASSIAQVCNISRSQVLEILKEIFTKLIDLSKASNEEIILDFKIGELTVTDKRELVFKNKDTFREKNDRKSEVMKAIREADNNFMKLRENPNVSYDVNKVASDILSVKSGNSYYVTVATPRTKTRSVISSKQHGKHRGRQQWSYLKKGEDYNKSSSISVKGGRSQLSKTRSQHRIHTPTTLLAYEEVSDKINSEDTVNTYGSVERNTTKNSQFQTFQKGKLPFPYLASFINKHSGGVHFGKRMQIHNLPSTDEVNHERLMQIEHNKHKKILENQELKQQEINEVMQMREDTIRDEFERDVDIKQKQAEFKRDMHQMQTHKKLIHQQEKEIQNTEAYDYFPFTHGENIDNMKENFKRVVLSNVKQRHNSSNNSVH